MPGYIDNLQSAVGGALFFVWASGGNGYYGCTAALPSAGSDVDGIISDGFSSQYGETAMNGYGQPVAAIPGSTFRVKSGAAITAGQLLETDASGQAVPHSTGIAVARALQSAAGAGTIIGAVFTSGR